MADGGNPLQHTYGFVGNRGVVYSRLEAIPEDYAVRDVVRHNGRLRAGPAMREHGLELDRVRYGSEIPDYAGFEFVNGAEYPWEQVYIGFDGLGRVTAIEFREGGHRVRPGIRDPVATLAEPINGEDGMTLQDLLAGETVDDGLDPLRLETAPDYDEPAASPERLKDSRDRSPELH